MDTVIQSEKNVESRLAGTTGSDDPGMGYRLWNCRLCKSVTFSVFLLILVIESIILVPSAYNFRTNALKMLEERATTAVHSVLMTQDKTDLQSLVGRFSMLPGDSRIISLSILNDQGATLATLGNIDFAGLAVDDVLRKRRSVVRQTVLDGTRHDIAWRETVGEDSLVFQVRMDSSHINRELLAFVLRIAGLVAIIVAVVTAGTMLVVHRSVLLPMLRLRHSMLGAAADPDHAEKYHLHGPARDEMEDVYATHNELLSRVAQSKRADRLRAGEEARFLARHDTLTGLPNRKFFIEHLGQALHGATHDASQVVVWIINLSGFRAVNDGLGQPAGDHVLGEIARRLDGHHSGQFTARLGGDEFGIVRSGSATPSDAAAQAEELLFLIAQPVAVDKSEARLSARIGIAFSQDNDDAETLLQHAELALSRIGGDTRDRYQFFSPSMDEEARRRQEVERELLLAVGNFAFELHYQPKIPLKANNRNRVAACEALIRWRHAQWGYVSPGQFIPIAEATGLINPIGTWALTEACAQIRRWQSAGLTAPRVAVNLSAEQFRDPRLPDIVRSALADNGVDSGLLELEITESLAMHDVELTVAILTSLRQLGIEISIDDFGTGYSSLSYLRRFEVDSIKIDKSFIDDIGRDANADAICKAIIGLSHSLGKRVVAEGVETELQLEFLRTHQCEEAQGFFFSRPVPANKLAAMLKKPDAGAAPRFSPGAS